MSVDRKKPFPESLCHRCRYLRLTGNKRGSVFLQCTEPTLPRYGPQPVLNCERFDARAEQDAPEDGRASD